MSMPPARGGYLLASVSVQASMFQVKYSVESSLGPTSAGTWARISSGIPPRRIVLAHPPIVPGGTRGPSMGRVYSRCRFRKARPLPVFR